MTTRIIECFEVMDHGEDGRVFPGRHVAYIADEKDAKALAGNWLSVGKKTIVVHDNRSDYDHFKSQALKDQALAKLTQEERLALGL